MQRPVFAVLALCTATAAAAEPFTFVALGDAPYGKPEEVYAPYEALIAQINARNPVLVVHIGDTKSGSTPCSDEVLTQQLTFMNSFTAPTLYTPGDNEWTDCHREAAGKFDPLERLNYLRTTYFGDGTKSFGQTKATLTSQAAAGYPENVRMMQGDVMFVTAHVVGSNNNFEIRDEAAVAEFFARDAANVLWLQESFAAASEANAMVISIQANMFEFDWNEFDDETWLRHSGFQNFGNTLIEQAAAFGKPVLLIYGDSHVFRQSRPFPTKAPNVLALEVPGDKEMHAVEVTVDTSTTGVFSTMFVRNEALVAN
ncbi:hypothetical protein [Tabrizicola sp.]|uniref:hypothetical protein n=1 Tax=Tabrizicola sp. TaxID=2005166 RepID=UPI003F30BB59